MGRSRRYKQMKQKLNQQRIVYHDILIHYLIQQRKITRLEYIIQQQRQKIYQLEKEKGIKVDLFSVRTIPVKGDVIYGKKQKTQKDVKEN